VDVLGINDYYTSFNTQLSLVNQNLEKIYDRLHDVNIDSFVNVRLMDVTGEFPVPCSELTGLLVSAYASGIPQHVVVDSGNIDALVSGTASNPIYVTSTPFDPFVITTITNPVSVRGGASLDPVNIRITSQAQPVTVSIPDPVNISQPVTVQGTVSIGNQPISVLISGVPEVNARQYLRAPGTNVRWLPAAGINSDTIQYVTGTPGNIQTVATEGCVYQVAANGGYGKDSRMNVSNGGISSTTATGIVASNIVQPLPVFQ
jgi:hypothetical protein